MARVRALAPDGLVIYDIQDEPGRNGETRPFPQVNVTLASGVSITSGREQFSTANQLDQDILEVTDSLTLVRGKHTFTVGTSNQFFKFRNLFIRDNFGTYSFSSLANFAAGKAQSSTPSVWSPA